MECKLSFEGYGLGQVRFFERRHLIHISSVLNKSNDLITHLPSMIIIELPSAEHILFEGQGVP